MAWAVGLRPIVDGSNIITGAEMDAEDHMPWKQGAHSQSLYIDGVNPPSLRTRASFHPFPPGLYQHGTTSLVDGKWTFRNSIFFNHYMTLNL